MKKIALLITIIFLSFNAFATITIDGNITESEWGTALSTASGVTSGFAGTNQLNAIYVTNDGGNNLLFGIAGNVVFGNRILLFIDSKSGGYADGSFDKSGIAANRGINNFNAGTTFDNGFLPDYCLVIGVNIDYSAYYFDLFKLSSTGSNNYLGDNSNANLGANPTGSDNTRGFEAQILKSALEYTGGDIKVMAMYITDAGFLSNQFLTPANSGQGDFGSGAVNFNNEPPGFITVSQTVLPVEMTAFEAFLISNEIILKWQTAMEINNFGFEIQRSENGKNWKNIAFVAGNGSSLQTNNYEYLDRKPLTGRNYYRLKQVDFNDNFEYSSIKVVDFKNENPTILIYPNPVKEEIYFTQPIFADVIIYNMNGQIVKQIFAQKTQYLEVSDLENGVYYLQFENEVGEKQIQRFIKGF